MDPSIPTRFVDPSQPRRLSPWQRWYYGGDPTPSPAQGQHLAELLSRGDPLADALVDHWVSGRGVAAGRRQLDLALSQGLDAIEDAPEPLCALFAQLERAPLWLDRARLEHGRRTGARVGIAGSYVLSSVALMGGYRFAAATKPLVLTGALEQRTVRRLQETSKFVCDVYARGGMERFGRGFQSTVKVRLMHALVRRSLAGSERWDASAWGLPINQADMLATNLLFSVVYLSGLRAMGMRFEPEESDGLMHLWRYVGHLIGVEDGLLPAGELEGRRISYAIFHSQRGADDDSRRLAAALTGAPVDAARSPRTRRIARLDAAYRNGLSRAILGRRIADELALADDAWKLAIAITTPATYLLESVRRRTPGLTELAIRLGERGLERQARRVTRTGEVTFMPTGAPRTRAHAADGAALHGPEGGARLPTMFASTTTTTTEVTTPRG